MQKPALNNSFRFQKGRLSKATSQHNGCAPQQSGAPPPPHRTPGANGVLDASTAKGISTNAFIALSSSDHAIAWLYVTA